MIVTKRPGTGISPSDWAKIIGKTVNKDLKKNHVLLWNDLYLNSNKKNKA